MVWSGYKAVDTFFTVGGMLTTMALMRTDFCLAKPRRSRQKQDVRSETVALPLNTKSTNGTENSDSQKNVNQVNNSAQDSGTGGGHDDVSPHVERMIEKDEIDQDWLEIKRQGVVKTTSVFLMRYAAYVIHRIIRFTKV